MTPNEKEDADNDAARRQQEMSWFAAMAAGGGSLSVDTTPKAATSKRNSSSSSDAEKIENNPTSSPAQVSSSVQFAEAASAVVNTGTFAMAPDTSQPAVPNSNLEAAAASFAGEDSNDSNNNNTKSNSANLHQGDFLYIHHQNTVRPRTKQTSMYTEKVLLPRPLFFGPILPPRVIKEARMAVANAMDEHRQSSTTSQWQQEQQQPEPRPRLSSLPPEVRNLVGTIEAFGFGLSAFPSTQNNNDINSNSSNETKEMDNNIDENDPSFWMGNPYVSTYQPVWGDVARAEREERAKQTTTASLSEAFNDICSSSANKEEVTSSPKSVPAGEATAEKNDDALSESNARQSTSDEAQNKDVNDPPLRPLERELFSRWAQVDSEVDDSGSRGGGSDANDVPPNNGLVDCDNNDEDSIEEVKREDDSTTPKDTAAAKSNSINDNLNLEEKPEIAADDLSERNLFSQWARGEDDTFDTNDRSGTMVMQDSNTATTAAGSSSNTSTQPVIAGSSSIIFTNAPSALGSSLGGDDDDDSIVGSEMKRKVGMNEHLEAAAASLYEDDSKTNPATVAESISAAESQILLSQLCPTTQGGRPLSNLEVTNGCVPLYGCDDMPLPIEADLGIFETKEDQLRNEERNKSQKIISKHAAPNIFGPVACPNPALGPDDSQSWNSRTKHAQRLAGLPPASASVAAGESPTSQRKSIGGGGGGRTSPSTLGNNSVTSGNHGRFQPPPPIVTRQHSSGGAVGTPRSTGTHKDQFHDGASTTGNSVASSKANGQRNISARFGAAGSNTRFGWWLVEDDGVTASAIAKDEVKSPLSLDASTRESKTDQESSDVTNSELQMAPLDHASGSLHVSTRLTPTPERLRDENFPLTHLHSASSTAEALPYLSDRSPSYRYIQIDTQAVGFPPLGGEVEPLFCSIAIYHVETISVGGNNPRTAPVPDLQRCGRITEVLNFDIVSDADVEAKCASALYPYTATGSGNSSDSVTTTIFDDNNAQTQGTRCGVFPLPSNLNIANLYAVLIVHKVLANEDDIDIYMKKEETSGEAADIETLRDIAESASVRNGHFTTPFAFGVAPLLQVIGTEIPTVPSSRAVQIPLFRMTAGQGERPIIDHIMVMLYPRADHGNANVGEVTNGGTAVLIVRNFGYLGLHSVVHSKSSLARDRLVDFSGELQIRRRLETDNVPVPRVIDDQSNENSPTYVVPPWRPQFVAEPTVNGGRNVPIKKSDKKFSVPTVEGLDSRSQLYAQELASVPLLLTPSIGRSLPTPPRIRLKQNGRSGTQCVDLEPSFHTAFCNELLCYPRLLHNCGEKNIVLKVELREVKWSEDYGAFLAFPPQSGPSMHNTRRGPFLVQEVFTSCALQTLDPHFLDEFKVKLPLILPQEGIGGGFSAGPLCLVFTAYNINLPGTEKEEERTEHKQRKIFGVKRSFRNNSSSASSDGGNSSSKNNIDEFSVDMLASGFLPVTTDGDMFCLIENGLHDVQLLYKARPSSTSPLATEFLPQGTLILEGSTATKPVSPMSARDNMEDSSVGRGPIDLDDVDTNNSVNTEPLQVDVDQLFLQVRIVVHSSVHPQNATLRKFLNQSPDQPLPLTEDLVEAPGAPWRLKREQLVARVKSVGEQRKSYNLDLEERTLVSTTVGVSKASRCPPSHSSLHVIRALNHLWRTTVTGKGEPSLEWANPSSLISLRLQSFASLLQMLNSVTNYLLKNGMTQLDGKGKFNMTVISRLVAMLFDEGILFGDTSTEEICDFQELFNATNNTNSGESSVSNVGPKSPSKITMDQRARSFPGSTSGARKKHTRSTHDSTWLSSREPTRLVKSETSVLRDKSASPEDLDDFLSSLQLGNDVSASFGGAVLSNSTTDKQKATPSSRKKDNSEDSVDSKGSNTSTTSEGSNTLDSTEDFLKAVNASANTSVDDFSLPVSNSSSGSSKALDMINAFSGMGNSNRRRFMTAPSSTLATIREDLDGGDNKCISDEDSPPKAIRDIGDALDTEIIIRGTKKPSKQMRVPRVKKLATTTTTISDQSSIEPPPAPPSTTLDSVSTAATQQSLPTSDEEIETAGTAFLDKLGEHFGSKSGKDGTSGEDHRVGYAHHRKTRSRCSIDWTLPETDNLMENQQLLEHRRQRSGSDQKMTGSTKFNRTSDHFLNSEYKGDISSSPMNSTSGRHEAKQKVPPDAKDFKNKMVSLTEEDKNTIRLPSFIDRILKVGEARGKGRWFPYAYEVIIFQWAALLIEQQQTGGKSNSAHLKTDNVGTPGSDSGSVASNRDHIPGQSLTHAANRSRGAAISCAPVLFAIIKKSLGFRINGLVRRAKDSGVSISCAPLVALDDTLFTTIERLISMLTDACIDSRNFDSWEFRQISIDVNDSIIHFLRDLFAFLEPKSVHRLIMTYFSRYVVKDGKHWQDRDSIIGLRCSWEVCKLRLNAISTFIRFPEFVRVCSPQMNSWGNWELTEQSSANRNFFDAALDHFRTLNLSRFTGTEIPAEKTGVKIPPLTPHWLAELAMDICLAGTEHVDQQIQQRAASLLYELFWSHSQEGRINGISSAIASMYVPFIVKVLGHVNYLSSFPAKSPLRKDILPCLVFVMQSAPVGLLRALWRKLSARVVGKGLDEEKYGAVGGSHISFPQEDTPGGETNPKMSDSLKEGHEADIFDVFSLLNLALSTFEYEGCDENAEAENDVDCHDQIAVWQREFLLAVNEDGYETVSSRFPKGARSYIRNQEKPQRFSTSSSRKWHGNDGSIVIINTSRQIVRETAESGVFRLPKHIDSFVESRGERSPSEKKTDLKFSFEDTVIFVRAATSLYLHSLALNQSDVAIVKTLSASLEVVKIFGIKIFMAAVGETLQHWMRVILLHCGARRSDVRIQALEFLAFILRLAWNTYGSFLRIRLPLLAVQAEVMERIVATATARNYREQRRLGTAMQGLANDSAEASLAPLWRTLDRLHQSSASNNVAFRSGLVRLAEKMKKLFRAYIAAHALAILNRARSPISPTNNLLDTDSPSEASVLLQRSRVSVHRIVGACAGFSKQFLGMHGDDPVAHNEAVEDAFLSAADVFSSTELPSHRVAWLRKLAEFHASRAKFAEEATCRFHIHITFRQAARLHNCLWSSTPFLPWTNDVSEGVHGEGPAGEPGEYYDADYDMEDLTVDDYGLLETESGKRIEKTNSFRRIFYRVANSVRMRTGDWDISGSKNLFYSVTFAFEYGTITPWTTLREMEEDMVDEAEIAGDLYLKAGIVESSRYSWNLATQLYAENFNYARLAYVYRRLTTVVASQVPVIDTSNPSSNPIELSSSLGRFYRVWFHGGAPDELIGAEFVYRAAGSVKLEQFGKELRDVVRSVLPDKNQQIDLVLDDGRSEESSRRGKNQRRPLGSVTMEPVKIKVTPLRPLLKRASNIRGTPEWFNYYTDLIFSGTTPGPNGQLNGRFIKKRDGIGITDRQDNGDASSRRHAHSSSFSASVFASGNLSMGGRSLGGTSVARPHKGHVNTAAAGGGELIDVDMFSFMQPMDKNRYRQTRDWLKASSGDLREKCLRVTQLQVEQSFPSCVSRHAVVHRKVFTQSPLEAGVDAVCSWCAVLFRTAVATNGQAVLGAQSDPGVGTAAAKVVADCIHSSRVREMGQTLLQRSGYISEENGRRDGTMIMMYSMLSDEEFLRLQTKLARSIVVFMELLHLLIVRNRDLLLAVVEARKRRDGTSTQAGNSASVVTRRPDGAQDIHTIASSPESTTRRLRRNVATSVRSGNSSSIQERSYDGTAGVFRQNEDLGVNIASNASIASGSFANDRTDSAIAVQSELQRAFVSMSKALYPMVSVILDSDTPRWFKLCCQSNYFSAYTYRQTRISIGEELFFSGGDISEQSEKTGSHQEVPLSYVNSFASPSDQGAVAPNESPNGSLCGSSTGKGSQKSFR